MGNQRDGATEWLAQEDVWKVCSLLGKSIDSNERAHVFFLGTEQGICTSVETLCSLSHRNRKLLGIVLQYFFYCYNQWPQSTCPYSVLFFEKILLRRQNPSPSICFTKYPMKPKSLINGFFSSRHGARSLLLLSSPALGLSQGMPATACGVASTQACSMGRTVLRGLRLYTHSLTSNIQARKNMKHSKGGKKTDVSPVHQH